jgi:sugar O-acyltransferase (sialic acid O-acetyltransferase NeuD family)
MDMVLGICGAGALGREVLGLAQEINKVENKWDVIIFIEVDKSITMVSGVNVLSFDEFKLQFNKDSSGLIIAIGEPRIRSKIREEIFTSGYKLHTLIHPHSFIANEVSLGEGVVINYGCWISCNVIIGDNVYLQPQLMIGHDCIIGSDTVISPCAAISGSCVIGNQVYIGLSTAVKENISIGSYTTIGMGSVVLRDIPENVIAYGSPARPIKSNGDGSIFSEPLIQ